MHKEREFFQIDRISGKVEKIIDKIKQQHQNDESRDDYDNRGGKSPEDKIFQFLAKFFETDVRFESKTSLAPLDLFLLKPQFRFGRIFKKEIIYRF